MFSYDYFDRICELPLRDQALCACVAAKEAIPLWEAVESTLGIGPTVAELLSAFFDWREGKTDSARLKDLSERFYRILPPNLPDVAETELRAAFAGSAILGVATVALHEAPEVQDSILQSTVVHAARSVAGQGRRELRESDEFLSAEEREFLSQWWERCCARFPQLRDYADENAG
jgi:hypothetical protein